MTNQIIKTITISTLASSLLLGATPTIGDIEKQIVVPDIKKEQATIPELKIKKYETPMSDSGKKILIKDFKITGNNHIESSRLEKFFIASKNKELRFNQLQEIASNITRYYREDGYFVARAYIPAQNLKANNNVLEIAIIEGSYGEFKLENKSLVKDSIVQGMLDDAKARDNVISTDTLERAMLIINDTPGSVVTQADVMPGRDVGTSDFTITTEASNRYDGYVVTDNFGSRYTGKYRLMAGLNINSPFEIGDKISLFALGSNGLDLKNGRVAYSAPLASNGLNGEISYAQTNYSLVEEYEDLDALGTSKTLNAKLSYPVIRTRTENLNAYINLTHKDLKDETRSTSDITKKDSNAINIGLNYDKNYLAYGFNSSSTVAISFTAGKLSFDDADDRDNDKAGANTQGSYSKVNLDLSHNIGFTPKLSLESSLSMQYALGNKNLDGSEDFSIGGSSGVKLYPSGEASAENGYLFSIEGKYKLPQYESLSSTVGVFYDIGRVHMADNTVDYESRTLQDIGVGYYASYKDFFGQVQAAWKVGNEDATSEPNRNSKILFQAGIVF